jgi:HK97 gp10 family phage protein
MATRPRNLTRGGGKKFRSQLERVEELEQKFRDLILLFQGKREQTGKAGLLKREVNRTLREAAEIIATEARSNAAANSVPQRVRNSIFVFADPKKDKPRRSSALVGVNKQRTMIEWTARSSFSPRAKVAPGGKVAMSLASMFERGTTRMKARPYFTPAVKTMRQKALDYLVHGYRETLEKFNDQPKAI